MTQYLLSIMQPDGPAPEPEALGPIMEALGSATAQMRETGALIFTNGLFPPSTATVVRVTGEEVLMTDGPYLEGKEHLGGLYVIEAPDLDEALRWGARIAAASTLPVEVRPFAG